MTLDHPLLIESVGESAINMLQAMQQFLRDYYTGPYIADVSRSFVLLWVLVGFGVLVRIIIGVPKFLAIEGYRRYTDWREAT